MTRILTAQEELSRLLDRSARLFAEAFDRWAKCAFLREGDEVAATRDLAELIRKTLILADLLGRRRALLQLRAGAFAADTPLTWGITFEEAVKDITSREPKLARSMEEVSRLYSAEHVFALTRSSTKKLTKRIQEILAELLEKPENRGVPENELLRAAVEESHAWTRAYAETVYRTNMGRAYVEGNFAQVKDPDVSAVIKAFEVVGIADDRERVNHRPARGLIAAIDDPIWNRLRPPYGFNCRHGVIFVDKYTLERKGLLRPDGSVIRYEPPGFDRFHPDPGFISGEF